MITSFIQGRYYRIIPDRLKDYMILHSSTSTLALARGEYKKCLNVGPYECDAVFNHGGRTICYKTILAGGFIEEAILYKQEEMDI